MISWVLLQEQIERYAENRLQTEREFRALKKHYLRLFHGELSPNWEQWKERAAVTDTSHLIPDFDEPPDKKYSVDDSPFPSILIATDGSQIFPSRHEIAPVALINISRIRIDYANYQEEPLLDSVPTLFMQEDFNEWLEREREISFEELVSDRRTLDELSVLASLAQNAIQNEGKNSTIPILALTDGSLVLWRLAGRSQQRYEKAILERYLDSLNQFQASGVPVAGYISNSGSREVAQLIRMVEERQEYATPPEPLVWNAQTESPLITDTVIFASFLKEGERSTLFHSRSKILLQYGRHGVSFFYLHVGDEIAKIEVPQWVARDRQWVDQVAADCLRQARLGGGYPIVLAEAHEQAVIRKEDRAAFYLLLEECFLQKGLSARLSPKELRKRVSIL